MAEEVLPWVEKHRPTKIDDICTDPNVVGQLKQMIKNKNIKNMLFEGAPGVGKTTMARCVAREVFGKYWEKKTMEINASDDRGAKLHNSIAMFSKTYVRTDPQEGEMPQFKIVILDEADNMTDKAKNSIVRMMETQETYIRFILTCNTRKNISVAVQSHCHIILFPKLDASLVKKRLHEICLKENVYSGNVKEEIDGGLDVVSSFSGGDLRVGINTLQLTYNKNGTVRSDEVQANHDLPHPLMLLEMLNFCIGRNIVGANNVAKKMRKLGYSVEDRVFGLSLLLRQEITKKIPDECKIKLLEEIGKTQYNISHGLEMSEVQMYACIADMCSAM